MVEYTFDPQSFYGLSICDVVSSAEVRSKLEITSYGVCAYAMERLLLDRYPRLGKDAQPWFERFRNEISVKEYCHKLARIELYLKEFPLIPSLRFVKEIV